MKEELLHYVWKLKKFNFLNLLSTEGEEITICDTGIQNFDAGPDFLNARIKINETIWVGNVEMHILASDWNRHNHHSDPVYNNVILHVVWKEDKIVYNATHRRMTTLEMSGKIDLELFKKYNQLISNQMWIPCETQLPVVDKFIVSNWVKKVTVERLEMKVFELKSHLETTQNHWEQLVFERICYTLGLKINKEAFEVLARSIPVERIYKHKDQLFQLEALLFGQAGLLSAKFKDDYAKSLLDEYVFLRHKYDLHSIPKRYWKFSRLRPANFPTIRIAQLAYLYHVQGPVFSKILEENIQHINSIFKNVHTSRYWEKHYLFDRSSDFKKKALGHERIRTVLINAIAPVLFLYGKEKNIQEYKDKSILLLESIKAEQNKLTARWKSLGIHASNAFDTQGLIQLKQYYCDRKKCLSCSIGHALLRYPDNGSK